VLDRFFHSFDHNSLVSRPFLARKVPNRSSHHALQNGQGAVSSIQLLVWSTIRSNLGQTWSTLVKLGQIWSKLSKLWEMYPGPRFEDFSAWWTLVGSGTARSNPGQHSVNLGQTWSTLVGFRETCPGPRFEIICRDKPSSDQADLVRATSFCVSTPEKIPGVKMG
jgi:hypothetical protein